MRPLNYNLFDFLRFQFYATVWWGSFCSTGSRESFVQLNHKKVFSTELYERPFWLNLMKVFVRLSFSSGHVRLLVSPFDLVSVNHSGWSSSWRDKCNSGPVKTSKNCFRILHHYDVIIEIASWRNIKGFKHRKIMTRKTQIWKYGRTVENNQNMVTCVNHKIYIPG